MHRNIIPIPVVNAVKFAMDFLPPAKPRERGVVGATQSGRSKAGGRKTREDTALTTGMGIRWLLVMVLVLSLPCAALAEAALGDYLYGHWSDWSTGWMPGSEKLDVQSRRASEVVLKDTWTYKRYIYYHAQAEAWYVTSSENPGAFVRPGSGRWETETVDARKESIGIVDGHTEYEGHWFFEEKGQAVDRLKPITQYRTRAKTLVRLKLKTRDMAIGIGETYKLEYELATGVNGISYKSSSTKVASVSADGMVRAVGLGSANIDIMIGGERVERLRLAVGERIRGIANSMHSIRLAGTELYLSPISSKAKAGMALGASDNLKPTKRYFRIVGQADNAFRLRLASQQVLYVSAKGKDHKLRLERKTGKLDQLFGILRLKGGQDLLHLLSDPTKYLAMGTNDKLEFLPFASMNASMRWELVEESGQEQVDGLWVLPYVRDGRCYISRNYVQDVHKGIDIGSNGARVDVLAVAPGKVVYTYTGCNHDYGKSMGAKGKIKDPCGDERSYGNQVVIQHANGMRTAYAHLSNVQVKEGAEVRQGDVIGVTGSTGQSTAVHLHFEVRAGSVHVNPRLYVELPKLIKE